MRFKSHLLICICFLVGTAILVGCSSKPSDVSQDIWDDGIQYTIYINELVKTKEKPRKGVTVLIGRFVNVDDMSSKSEKEQEILVALKNLTLQALDSIYHNKEQNEEYSKNYEKLESIFGKDELNPSKLDKEKIESAIYNAEK